jgi:hypothetical protein
LSPPSSPYFPFHAIGFRCNPFRELTRQEWVELIVLPPDVMKILDEGFTHLQILGEKGSGKTTRLISLQAHLDARGWCTAYEYLPEGQVRFCTQPDGLDYFLLDEVQRLSPGERKRLLKFTGAEAPPSKWLARHELMNPEPRLHLVLGSHADLSPLFTRWGLPLQTLSIQNRPENLQEILTRRLDYFSLEAVSPVRLDEQAVLRLYQHFGGDFRAVIDCLYELFQRFPPPGVIDSAQVQAAIELYAAQG